MRGSVTSSRARGPGRVERPPSPSLPGDEIDPIDVPADTTVRDSVRA